MSRPLLTVNDGYEIVSKKILIGRISKTALEKQIEYSNVAIQLQTYVTFIARKKIELIDKLELVFEKQLSDFDVNRQQECVEIYSQINVLDNTTVEQNRLISRLDAIDSEMRTLYEQITEIEKTIPVDKVLTQYAVNAHQSKQL